MAWVDPPDVCMSAVPPAPKKRPIGFTADIEGDGK